ncbi:MAG: MOSC domain-containing protein [Actinomycetota bacterium]|nr:MOSC domain-containing protein [Actinomycetota bacterium]
MRTVSLLSITPVKSLGLHHPREVTVGPRGVEENRRFFLTGAGGRLFGGTKHGPLVQIRADYDPERERLSLRFPDGSVVDGEIELGPATRTSFYGRTVPGRVVEGPWSAALSDYAGTALRLVRADNPGDGSDVHVATLYSQASVEELSRRAGRDRPLDARRFRILVEVSGCAPHEEDGWSGRDVRVGEALLRVGGPIPRCAVTTQDPTTGVRDFDTLRAIKSYRGVRDGKKIDFGVYADVREPGRVRLGDPVEPL